MYLAALGLRSRPFRTGPDPDSYYPATTHEEASASLRQGLDEGEAFVVLTGLPGAGKTLLARRLVGQLPEGSRCGFLIQSRLETRRDLLLTLCYDLGLPHEGKSEQELRIALTESCVQHFAAGGRTVLIFDEAHHLSPDLLEELRFLSNLEDGERRAVQVVLVGLPSLVEVLESKGMEALYQRVAVVARLAPLEPNEAADYLLHQIRVAGGRPDAVFTAEALELLAGQVPGVPRLLNQVGHLCLKLVQAAGLKQVDAEVAMEAVERRVATVSPRHLNSDATIRDSESSFGTVRDDANSTRLLPFGG